MMRVEEAGRRLSESLRNSERLEAMARKKPDYKQEAERASAAFTALKIKHGALHAFYLGSGDRKWAIERLKR